WLNTERRFGAETRKVERSFCRRVALKRSRRFEAGGCVGKLRTTTRLKGGSPNGHLSLPTRRLVFREPPEGAARLAAPSPRRPVLRTDLQRTHEREIRRARNRIPEGAAAP